MKEIFYNLKIRNLREEIVIKNIKIVTENRKNDRERGIERKEERNREKK